MLSCFPSRRVHRALTAKLLTLADARRTYGLSRKRLYKLIADGLLRAVSGPQVDGHPIWQFEEAALEDAVRLVERSKNGSGEQKENERL